MALPIVDAKRASAQTEPRVDVPSECGSRDEFLREVAGLQRTAHAKLTVSEVVIARRDEDTYQLSLTSAEGLRLVVDPDCRTLLKTAAVIAATMAESDSPAGVAPGGEAGETPSSPSTSSPGEALEVPQETTPDPKDRAPLGHERQSPKGGAPKPVAVPRPDSNPALYEPNDSTRSVAVQLGVGAAAFYGLTPAPHLGAEATAGITGKRWGGHLVARVLPPRSMLVEDEVGLRQTIWGARLSGSRSVTDWLRLSVGLSGYWISAQGLGISDPATDGVGLLAPEAEVAAALPLHGAFRAEFGFHGRIGLSRPRFVTEPGRVVYELPGWGGGAALRVLWTEE